MSVRAFAPGKELPYTADKYVCWSQTGERKLPEKTITLRRNDHLKSGVFPNIKYLTQASTYKQVIQLCAL